MRTPTPLGWDIGDTNDALDALAVYDALAGCNFVASQLDPLADRVTADMMFDANRRVMTAGSVSRCSTREAPRAEPSRQRRVLGGALLRWRARRT